MRVVIGLGGNALLQRGQSPDVNAQRANIHRVCQAIVPLIKQHQLILTHGNGPQVGLLALQAEAYQEVPAYPLDVLGAQTQGMIGYLLSQELMNQLPEKWVVTLLTQVMVDIDDAAFKNPSKFIGPVYTSQQIEALRAAHSWDFKQDGTYWRRVVPSPLPRKILEIEMIKQLVELGALVICGGGGGIPVVQQASGCFSGVEAVIDKDWTTALLAKEMHADRLLFLTDTTHVFKGWGTSQATPIKKITVSEMEKLSFASGSMGPKVQAACAYVRKTGNRAYIGALQEAEVILAEETGTMIV